MKTNYIKSAGVLLLGLLMLSTVNAQSARQGGRGQGAFGDGDFYGRWHAMLDLTQEQEEQMTTLCTEHFKAMTPLRNKLAESKARERTLLSEENVDLTAVNKSIDEQTDLMNSMRKLQAKHQLAVKNILSDEQLMKLQQGRKFAQRDGFHGKGSHRGGRDAGPGRGYRGI
ncbi:MAG: Spy/CpxP family protein refolding chaperone [Bacteroidales bacterium]|nr:Spy/CpxP family protein refolding chaperone [Bacteroidales bacterium]